MKKAQNFLIAIFILLFFCTGYAYLQEKNRKEFFQNRYLELELMRRILLETESNLSLIKKKFPNAEDSNKYIVIPPELVVNDPFFIEMGYKIGKSDFHGYEFEVNSSSSISSVYLHKP